MEQGKRTKDATDGRHAGPQKIGGDFTVAAKPAYIDHRVSLFDKLYEVEQGRIGALVREDIKITLPDGSVKEGKAFETTALDIAKSISNGLAKVVIAAKVHYTRKIEQEGATEVVKALGPGEECLGDHDGIVDLTAPLEGDCNLELIKFDAPEGKEVFWHSSAHILGCALENMYGIHLTHGPPLSNGFFYDFFMGNDAITPEKFKEIEKEVNKVIKKNDPFQKLVLSKPDALEMFKHNPFKVSFINSKVPDGASTSVYKSGTLIDLCPGPHVPSTSRVKAMSITKCSATNWLGDIRNDSLQRVYGISFPSKKELKEWKEIQAEIAKRDHRIVGEKQKLFAMTKYAPGMPSFLPHGTVIWNKLCQIIKTEYHSRGFHEVNTPSMNLNSIWKTSGHYFKYKAGMFFVNMDEGQFGIKPMNCPGHCALFDLEHKSYRDLPYRIADFGVLHRNEMSGALSGLTRVRKFQQDDAHIFCTDEQVFDEVMDCLDFVDYIYGLFGFQYSLELSTRPVLRVGDDKDWDKAEGSLRQALDKFGREYTIGEGEGAFYGPKIDILVLDCFKRKHQLGTIQLDFNLPDRFNLQYRSPGAEDTAEHISEEELNQKIKDIKEKDLANQEDRAEKMQTKEKDGKKEDDPMNYEVSGKLKNGFLRPNMIHRAVLGSLERCLAILIEVYGGKWPFWLSPRQVIVLPLSEKFQDYAESVYSRLKLEGYQVEIDRTAGNIKKKVRNAQLEAHNFMLVLGEQEANAGTVNVRQRDIDRPIGVMSVDELLAFFKDMEPKASKATDKLRKAAYFKEGQKEHAALNEEIKGSVYFENDGFEFGPRDEEIYEQIKDQKVCSVSYPDLARWLTFVTKTQFSK